MFVLVVGWFFGQKSLVIDRLVIGLKLKLMTDDVSLLLPFVFADDTNHEHNNKLSTCNNNKTTLHTYLPYLTACSPTEHKKHISTGKQSIQNGFVSVPSAFRRDYSSSTVRVPF